MMVAPGVATLDLEADPQGQARLRRRAGQGLRLLQGRVLRHRAHARADRALLPLRGDGRRGEPAGALPDGPGRLGQELAGRAAEARPRGAADPIYAIEGCPMHEEPLHLIPRHLRPAFEKMLGGQIEGDLCPVCRYRLKDEFGGTLRGGADPHRSASRKRARRGIGVVPPVDPNNQDTSVLIGSEDISKLDRYSEGDPRVLELNGALQRRQPRHGRVHRGLQERDRVPAHHDHRDAGEVRAGARPARHDLRRHGASSRTRTRPSGRSSRPTTPTRRSSTASWW